jgi:predicted nucleic acid-binding protein
MPAGAPRIVLDSNVLYAGLYSSRGSAHRLLREIADRKVRIALSTPLLFEYEDALRRNQSTLGLGDGDIDAVLLCALADLHTDYFLWRPCLPDAGDDMVLELAVAAQVRRIVTFNVRDFGPASRFGIEVVKPKTVLEEVS